MLQGWQRWSVVMAAASLQCQVEAAAPLVLPSDVFMLGSHLQSRMQWVVAIPQSCIKGGSCWFVQTHYSSSGANRIQKGVQQGCQGHLLAV